MRFSLPGFTLIETLAALTVGTMVLIVVLAIYSRAQAGAVGVINKLESNRLPQEVFQRIAEDLDRVAGLGQDARITIDNKFQDGLPVAKLEILRTISDAKDQPQPLEKIVWQSGIEPENLGAPGLVLYRSHSGIAQEDNLLDAQKEPWQRELFVPICTGLTFFQIGILKGDSVLDKWADEQLPPAVTVTLSFAQPYKTAGGTLDVAEQDKFVRTIVIDRTRKPTFNILASDVNSKSDVNQPSDANKPSDANNPSDSNQPAKSQEQPDE
ncbi:MAG: prepilin-type N-terminal cleavage/methylation domain-containing protein [Sedimentisphaerales bacterium]|jgi:hypothetical protein